MISGAVLMPVSQPSVGLVGRPGGGPVPVPVLGRGQHQEAPALREAGRRRPQRVLDSLSTISGGTGRSGS